MRRREFIVGLGSALGMPLSAKAQNGLPVIGFFDSTSLVADRVAGFRRGLSGAGLIEGQNVSIEFRPVHGRYDQLAAHAAELVNLPVNIILGAGLPTTRAAKDATKTVPIVFVMGADPVKLGIVESLNRPGANITGVSQLYGGLGAKRLELIRELTSDPQLVAVLSNPTNPNAKDHLDELSSAARILGQRIEVFTANTEAAITIALSNIATRKAEALVIADDPLFTVRREQLVALAARHALPTIYYSEEFTQVGGLISYGSTASDNYRLAGGYVARILNGARPSDLPVLLPTKFDISINVKTAKTLGLTVSPTLLARADEVIE
jgi:putative ABC transport system substrate-binding protein